MPNAILRNLVPQRRSLPPKSLGSQGKSFLRPDIQGLRAFAVIAVVLDHLLGWPAGGFVGVDIFFVISGFLITGLLLREHDRTGRIAFGTFYKRRTKRILPAAALVLFVTVTTSFFLFNQARATATLWDGIWACFFGANWRQASMGTDYFAASGPVSPLQHYWSLAVEEQFYFIWPWLMLGLFALTGRLFRGRANPRVVAGVAMAVLTLASLAWSIWETGASPNVAYFSTFSRAWELGIGALLACSATLFPRIPALWRPIIAWVGLSGMSASLFVIDAQTAFPGPTALLPVLSAGLVIVAGTGASKHEFLAPLTNPVSRYIGDISYSLYLWHFPVVIFGPVIVLGDQGLTYNICAAAAMLLLSVFAYHLFEDPIRKSKWLTGERNRGEKVQVSHTYKVTALGALATVAAVVVGAALAPKAPVETLLPVQPAAVASTGPVAGQKMGPEVTALQGQITQALAATSWPSNLTPTMDQAVGNHEAPQGIAECGKQVAPAGSECVWGDADAPKTAMLVGDSVALAWSPALLKTYGSGDWKFVMRAQYGCPFVEREAKNESQECAEHKAAVVAQVQEMKPDLLILANNYPDSGDASAWARSGKTMFAKAGGAARTVVLASPPHDKDVQTCYTPASSPTACVSRINGWYNDLTHAEKRSFQDAGADYVDTSSLFCSPQGNCPSFIGETPVKLDQVHITRWYAEKIGPALGELLAP